MALTLIFSVMIVLGFLLFCLLRRAAWRILPRLSAPCEVRRKREVLPSSQPVFQGPSCPCAWFLRRGR